MASLRKMQILGIRSFGPDENDAATVTFNAPLTLILGQNGCGKTTIIEALKYATCGELPANTNQGQAFVFDPKINNRVEVRGQVKLVCNTIKGDQICIARSVSVQQKVKKLTFKTLDSTITRINEMTDEKEMLSGRCADVDTEMCIALGVTKPILHYVIFCHQEDSCWPLEENKKLKEKFDAIFDSTKYNKCLEQMRKERKDAMIALKLAQNNLVYLKKFEVEARKKRERLEDQTEKLNAANQKFSDLAEQLVPLKNRLNEIKVKEEECNKLERQRDAKKGALEELQNSKRTLLGAITEEFEGSDEQLDQAIKNFDGRVSEQKDQLDQLQNEKEIFIMETNGIQEKIDAKNLEQGALIQAEETYKKTINNRNKEMTILANKVKMEAPNASQMTSSGMETRRFLDELSNRVKECKDSIIAIQASQDETERQLQAKIDVCRDKKTRLDHDIQTKEKQLKSTEAEYKQVTDDILDADQSVTTLLTLESKLTRVSEELDAASQEVNLEELENSIKEQKEEKYRLEDEMKAIDKELEDLIALRDTQIKLEGLQTQKKEQEDKVQVLKDKHGNTVQHLLGNFPDHQIKASFNARVAALTQEIKSKEKAMTQKNDKLIKMRANCSNKTEKLNEMKNDLRAKEEQIQALCEDKDFDTVLNEVKSDIEARQKMKGTWVGSEFMYKNFITKLRQPNSCCPLCHRGFDSQEEAVQLAGELDKTVTQIPMQSQATLKELDALLEKQSELLQLKPVYDKMTVLKNVEIPALTEEVQDMEKEIEKLQQEYTEIENELKQPKEDEAMGKTAQADIAVLDGLMATLLGLERKSKDLEDKMGSKNRGTTYEEVQETSKAKKESLAKVSKTLDDNQTKLQKQSKKLNELRENKNELVRQQLELRSKSQRRAELGEKQTELEALKVTLRTEIDQAREELEPLASELKALNQELKDMKKQHRLTLDEERRLSRMSENKYDEIIKLQLEIDEYEMKDETMKLNSLKDELNALQQQKNGVGVQIASLEGHMKKIEEFVSNLQTNRQNLVNNKMLRQKGIEEKKYEEDIRVLGVQLESLDRDKVLQELKEINAEEIEICREQAKARGIATELKNTIKGFEKELRAHDYRNAEENYKSQLIEIKVREMALTDLGNYILALEWAMIHFHKERMRTINLIIRNLWRQIYSGNDIDTIEIKTEESDCNSADKKRVYNYRVVCKRGDTEMDMRGRCSAGQKVLACLIIRMALAETFSKNCGILALDEPTTNLDQENIDSLSQALAEIIAARSKQKNFQLIVITHDEEFLMRLSHNEKIPFYLKVQRNRHGKSEVVQVRTDN